MDRNSRPGGSDAGLNILPVIQLGRSWWQERAWCAIPVDDEYLPGVTSHCMALVLRGIGQGPRLSDTARGTGWLQRYRPTSVGPGTPWVGGRVAPSARVSGFHRTRASSCHANFYRGVGPGAWPVVAQDPPTRGEVFLVKSSDAQTRSCPLWRGQRRYLAKPCQRPQFTARPSSHGQPKCAQRFEPVSRTSPNAAQVLSARQRTITVDRRNRSALNKPSERAACH